MAKSSGGGGRGGGLLANATGGTVRTIAGQKWNTADLINRAIAEDMPVGEQPGAARGFRISANISRLTGLNRELLTVGRAATGSASEMLQELEGMLDQRARSIRRGYSSGRVTSAGTRRW